MGTFGAILASIIPCAASAPVSGAIAVAMGTLGYFGIALAVGMIVFFAVYHYCLNRYEANRAKMLTGLYSELTKNVKQILSSANSSSTDATKKDSSSDEEAALSATATATLGTWDETKNKDNETDQFSLHNLDAS